jgi:hypothetical protein
MVRNFQARPPLSTISVASRVFLIVQPHCVHVSPTRSEQGREEHPDEHHKGQCALHRVHFLHSSSTFNFN